MNDIDLDSIIGKRIKSVNTDCCNVEITIVFDDNTYVKFYTNPGYEHNEEIQTELGDVGK